MDATADTDHFIVAYPQALIGDGLGYDWNIPGEPMVNGKSRPASAPSDVTFLTTLVRDLTGRYCVDLSQLYATGVSGGGRMASQLACDASSVIAAIAPVAGLRYPEPVPGVPARAGHRLPRHRGPHRPVQRVRPRLLDLFRADGRAPWAGHDHCAASPQTIAGHGYRLTRYTGCSGGAEVELYAITGEGHEWPGGPAMPSAITSALGPQSDAVSANALMWAFFRAHSLS